MTDDELLKAMGEAARSDGAHDPRWDALATGDLSDAEQAALGALAGASAEARAAHEAFRPIDDAARERAVDHIVALIDAEGTVAPPTAPSRRRRTWAAAVSAGVLAAAACLLFFGPGRSRDEPVPAYALTIEGDQTSRGDPVHPDEVAHLRPRSRAEITLRPVASVQGPVAVRCFLAQAGTVRGWEAPVAVAAAGAVHLEGERGTLFPGVPAGRWEMIFAVGRPDALPKTAGEVLAALRRGDGGEKAAFRVLRGVVVLEDDTP